MNIWPTLKRTGSVVVLLLFMMSEVYSALATALGKSADFPSWESVLGWWLLLLPCLLLFGIALLVSKQSRLVGTWSAALSLCFYAAFLVFEVFAYRGGVRRRVLLNADTAFWATTFAVGLCSVFTLRKGRS